MNRKEETQARVLVEALVQHTRNGSQAHGLAIRLQELLRPQPTLGEIILALPAETHKDRAAMIGISRQAYYNLIQGIARPNTLTSKRLADMTGLSEEVIRQSGP